MEGRNGKERRAKGQGSIPALPLPSLVNSTAVTGVTVMHNLPSSSLVLLSLPTEEWPG